MSYRDDSGFLIGFSIDDMCPEMLSRRSVGAEAGAMVINYGSCRLEIYSNDSKKLIMISIFLPTSFGSNPKVSEAELPSPSLVCREQRGGEEE